VNAVANAILVERLSRRKNGTEDPKVARFVLVSSEAHRWAKGSEIDATLNGLQNPPPYTTTNAFEQYSRCVERLMLTRWFFTIYTAVQEQIASHDVAV
jgi:hypothetical protein